MKRIVLATLLALSFFAAPALAGPGGTTALLPYMDLTSPPTPRLTVDTAPTVGTQLTFWGWDLSDMPPTDRQFTATCRGVSDFGYVFVEDDLWNVDMDQDDVDAILQAWDESTPAGSIDPDAGIYDIETDVYGDPPDVDGWPGVVLLYYEIGCFMGQCFDGFYRYDDQSPGTHSNLMDMIHLEGKTSDPGSEYMLGVTAHEFNHMLQMQHDLNEETWLAESLAEAAMILTGYDTDIGWLNDFVANPESCFWDQDMEMHYGAALLLGTYLYEYGGVELLQGINADDANGESSIEAQLSDIGMAATFNEFFGDMTAAIAADYFVDNTKGPDHFEYELLEIGELSWTDEIAMTDEPFTLPLNIAAGTMQAYKFTMEPDEFTQVVFLFPDNSADMVEGAMVDLRAAEFGVLTTRFNSQWDAWPQFNSTFHGTNGLLLVLANPTHSDIETSVDIDFELVIESPDDDDDNDDNDDIDDDDDDNDDNDDNDDFGDDDDDDDDDSGSCGC